MTIPRRIDRVVVGGGLFGCYAALRLASSGLSVMLIEADSDLLNRASFVNQARLHTGLHYPRSLLTAGEALRYYYEFRERFHQAIRDFTQIYAVATFASKTNSRDFEAFIGRLGLECKEIRVSDWFHSGRVSAAFQVVEPSFDAEILRSLMREQLTAHKQVEVRTSTRLLSGYVLDDGVRIELSDGSSIQAGRLVIAAYAGTNSVRESLGLSRIPIAYELTEVILGIADAPLSNVGITVMDGPFWSLMPFGRSRYSSLTSVSHTPMQRNKTAPEFSCQTRRKDCAPTALADCNNCAAKPPTTAAHQVQQMSQFLKSAESFRPQGSIVTVKAILSTSEVDDARPTLIHHEPGAAVTTIFSGKVSTIFDLDEGLL